MNINRCIQTPVGSWWVRTGQLHQHFKLLENAGDRQTASALSAFTHSYTTIQYIRTYVRTYILVGMQKAVKWYELMGYSHASKYVCPTKHFKEAPWAGAKWQTSKEQHLGRQFPVRCTAGDSKIFAASMHYAKCALVFKFGGLQLVLTGLHKLKDQITIEVGASQLAEVGASQLAEVGASQLAEACMYVGYAVLRYQLEGELKLHPPSS